MEDTQRAADHPFVTVVIPVLNEERFIVSVLESLGCLGGRRCLSTPHEVIVVDGGSTDRTLDILAGIERETGIRIVHNPARLQASSVNLAAMKADPRSRYLVRVDAHAIYEAGFVERVVTSLVETGASSVVVPLITRPHLPAREFAWAVTAAQRSKLGNGGAAHRIDSTPAQWVDHGHHAGFDLAFFRSLGGYDETFATNEDAEYDTRVLKAGGKIWFEPEARVWYSPRETAAALGRQYFRYGVGRASTILKHRVLPKPRQLFPVVAFMANATGLLGSLLFAPLIAIPILYVLACFSAIRAGRRSDVSGAYKDIEATLAIGVMHMTWAAGFLYRFVSYGRSAT